MILDLFSGPRGWSEGLRSLGRSDVGIEIDASACATAAAAGHLTIRADVARYPAEMFAGRLEGLIGSPPCQTFSRAGKRAGLADPKGQLVWEPVRWAEATRPRWVALEQVPDVLPIWRLEARRLEELGYSTWTGCLSAEMYGVPQTRERAILLASLDRKVTPPDPTHQRYESGVPAQWAEVGMFGEAQVRPWVSMAEALGWTGELHTNRGQNEDGSRQVVSVDRPAPALTGKAGGQWEWQALTVKGTATMQPRRREAHQPAPALAFGHNAAGWCWQRPATTVAGDPRITAPVHHDNGSQGRNPLTTEQVRNGEGDGTQPIKLTLAEALVLQSFRPDYPVQGTKTKQFEQVGNAIPPLLAAAILRQVL